MAARRAGPPALPLRLRSIPVPIQPDLPSSWRPSERSCMRNCFLLLVASAVCLPATQLHADITLTGRNATPETIAAIAQGERVAIAPEASKLVEKAHKVLVQAAAEGQMIYGLTVGV